MKKLFIVATVLIIFNTCSVNAQSSIVEIIDYYGNGYTPPQTIPCLTFHEKDSITFIEDDLKYETTKAGIESCLLKMPGIHSVRVTFVCCTQPEAQWMVYLGADTVQQKYKSENKIIDIKLPTQIHDQYNKLLDLTIEAIEKNQVDEDNSHGYSLMFYTPARKVQESFIIYANNNFKLLKSVLLSSKYSEEREIAAMVLAYADDKQEIVNILLEAALDPEESVRNNAVHAIGVIADFSLNFPELNIVIGTAPLIQLMNSISWTDRNKSSIVLLSLTKNRNPEIIQELKSKAMKSLLDMAGWINFGHSLPGYILLGRIAGWSEQQIMSVVNDNRVKQLRLMLEAIR